MDAPNPLFLYPGVPSAAVLTCPRTLAAGGHAWLANMLAAEHMSVFSVMTPLMTVEQGKRPTPPTAKDWADATDARARTATATMVDMAEEGVGKCVKV